MDNPVPRHLGHGAVHRQMAVEVIRERLLVPRSGAEPPRISELLGRKQRLHEQPWRRRPRRPGAESASTMELIRRFEARLKAH
jgi:hypothetical protein